MAVKGGAVRAQLAVATIASVYRAVEFRFAVLSVQAQIKFRKIVFQPHLQRFFVLVFHIYIFLSARAFFFSKLRQKSAPQKRIFCAISFISIISDEDFIFFWSQTPINKGRNEECKK
jgi:hypothetical protein